MTALFAIVTFFFIFVIAYLAVCMVLAAATWVLKHHAAATGADERIYEIERKMDRIKEKAFVIALVLTFFIIAPFVVITVFVMP